MDNFWIICSSFLEYLGIILRYHLAIIFGLFWHHFGIMFGIFWHFKVMSLFLLMSSIQLCTGPCSKARTLSEQSVWAPAMTSRMSIRLDLTRLTLTTIRETGHAQRERTLPRIPRSPLAQWMTFFFVGALLLLRVVIPTSACIVSLPQDIDALFTKHCVRWPTERLRDRARRGLRDFLQGMGSSDSDARIVAALRPRLRSTDQSPGGEVM